MSGANLRARSIRCAASSSFRCRSARTPQFAQPAGSPAAISFRDALTQAGAGTIIAWDGNSNAYGAVSMRYMFDRLTGVNAWDPADPTNRAYELDDVWTFMREKTDGGVFPNLLITPNVDKKRPGPDAVIKRFGNGFDLSNPVITELEMDYGDKLVIHGNFGTTLGGVTVGGAQLSVAEKDWKNDRIELTLPTGTGDPAGSHGEVVVTARKRKSNRRVLTSWRGNISYVLEDRPSGSDEGELTVKLDVEVHLRGDAHAMRTEVDGTVKPVGWNLHLASDSKASYRAAGTRTDSAGNVIRSYAGAGQLTYTDVPESRSGSNFSMIARVDALQKRLELCPFQPLANLISQTDASGNKTERPLIIPSNLLGFWDEDGTLQDKMPLIYGTYLPYDANANVQPYEKAITQEHNQLVLVRTTATAMVASPPFDDTVGR